MTCLCLQSACNMIYMMHGCSFYALLPRLACHGRKVPLEELQAHMLPFMRQTSSIVYSTYLTWNMPATTCHACLPCLISSSFSSILPFPLVFNNFTHPSSETIPHFPHPTPHRGPPCPSGRAGGGGGWRTGAPTPSLLSLPPLPPGRIPTYHALMLCIGMCALFVPKAGA